MRGLESNEKLLEFDVVDKGKQGGTLRRKVNKV